MMRALARPVARAPAVIAFLLFSIAAHLVVLRGASVSGWFAAPPSERTTVTVDLIVPAPAPAPPPEAVPAAAPVRPKPASRPRPRPAPRAAPAPAAPAALAPQALPPEASLADSDPFGAMLDLGKGDASPADEAESAAQAGSGEAPGSSTASSQEAAAQAQPPAEAGASLPETAPAASPAEAPIVVTPQSGEVRYLVHYGDPLEGNVVATLEQSFEIGPQHYRLHSEGRAKGLVSWFYRGSLVQDSVGTVSAAGLAPSSYRERRGDRPPRSATIDAAHGEVVFGSGQRREAPAGVQDRLSVTVQLALMRQSRPAQFEPGARIRLPMLGSSSVEPVDWVVIGEETVDTDTGAVRTLRLNRASTGGDDPAIDVWLALDQRIVPVRMRITERTGRALDQVLASQ
ncbi:MAG: hypothetical protein ABS56_02555 [Lautropia sp. SCN 69-89]|nr:MAG: hypothetical protein ABS56_02555 [Lautropia sp. SCN 69-89]